MAGDLGLVQKTVAIVRAVAAHPDGIGLSDLAREVDISKATCHRVLGSLEREGWLALDPLGKRYRLSLDLVFMAESLISEGSVARFTFRVLRDLTQSTRETAGIDRLAESEVMVLAEVQGPHLIGHAPRPVPRRLSAWRTSTGRALLAFGDPEVVRADFERDAGRPPVSAFASFEAFADSLAEVRERGYAVTRSELEDGLTAVAAPVRVGDGTPYALWVSGPGYRMNDEQVLETASELRDAAARLGRVLEQGGSRDGVADVDAIGAGILSH
ncbi:IclR family transcriptional regulator [Agromyces atrinae]|uniref:IclR family transcriptional regulator n=1 Tax=Agromyces atrinae TaxID=592376 RepID=A0A4V1R2N7_9MICO|nr:IclR family transcriptional regulator [Agromyces atrinae]NYD68053.1 DNA-binding IclR family transcriptional regulator [Agromyces atrinae]RXZ87796.1 IclR family transcriptional regulator [Agromyces atrinae]